MCMFSVFGLAWVLSVACVAGPAPTQDGMESITTAGRYVDVRFVVKNTSTQTRKSAFNPLLVDEEGRTFGGLAVGIVKFHVPKGTRDHRWHDMQPGEETEFRAIYDVDQADAGDLHLEVSGGAGEVTLIELPL